MSGLRDFFFNYEAKEGITNPTEYPYMIMSRHLLTVITCWPKKPKKGLNARAKLKARIWVTVQKAFHLNVCFITTLGMAMYIALHKKSMSFFELGHLYISLLMTVVIFTRITTLCLHPDYRAVATEFLTKIHLFYFKDDSEFSMQTHKQIHTISHLFTLYLTGQMIAGLSLFNLTPMYNNFSAGKYKKGGLKNSTFEHTLYFAYPFNASSDVWGYIVSNILHWIISYLCSTWFCTLDLFLSIMVFHVWGHFKILLHELNLFPRPSNRTTFRLDSSNITLTSEMYSSRELGQVSERLKKCIEYHRKIVSFTDKMSKVFGPMLFVYYGFHQTSGCLLLLECSQMTVAALVRYLPLTIILFQQLIQLSIIFELVGSVSDKLKDAVYGLPWEAMDTKNRKTVAVFLLNVQKPVHVKALGLAEVGVATMAAILKTSMSYFAFLRSK
uniref:Odorant receptor n=1 Tax=Heliothis subflexa TaxID=38041 RepID=A0A8E4HTQ8_HELSB|nr:olfactory receptor OR14 [Heliothis subflexa]